MLFLNRRRTTALRAGRRICVCAAATVSASNAAVATADLRIDLRATAVNGVAITGAQTPHFIPNALVGDVISFDVFTVVRGTDANFLNDRIIATIGSFHSTNTLPSSPLLGNLLMDVVRTQFDPDTGEPIGPPGFDNLGYSVGTQQDLDADGDIDVGSNNPDDAEDHWAIRTYLTNPGPNGPGASSGLPSGRKVGFGTFTVTGITPAGETLLRFVGRSDPEVAVATYVEDGIVRQDRSFDSLVNESILVTTVPEPGFTMAGAGGCALLARRARQRRKSEEER